MCSYVDICINKFDVLFLVACGFCLCRFNHKTGAEDVHFTSVLSDSDSDSEEGEPEPTTPDNADEILDETTKEATKRINKLNASVCDSPKLKEATKDNFISNGDEGSRPKEAIKKRGKLAPTAADSPKPKNATYKRRSKSVPIEEEIPTKEGDESDPIVKEENAEEENIEENANWEGSSEVLEMIMVKDVAKGSEVGNLYRKL